MASPWQFIPQDALDSLDLKQKADAWAAGARAKVAQEWADLHTNDIMASVAKYAPPPSPVAPPSPSPSGDPGASSPTGAPLGGTRDDWYKIADEATQAAQQTPASPQGDAGAGSPSSAGTAPNSGDFQGQSGGVTVGQDRMYGPTSAPTDTSSGVASLVPGAQTTPPPSLPTASGAVSAATSAQPTPTPPTASDTDATSPAGTAPNGVPSSGAAPMVTGTEAGNVGPGPQVTPADVVANAPQGIADTLGAARQGIADVGGGMVDKANADFAQSADLNRQAFANPTDANVQAAIDANSPYALALTGEPLAKAGGTASGVLPRMAGTAEQAAQLRPTEAGDAANVLLSKFSPDVRPLLSDAADAFNQFAGQRRGVVTDDQALQNAAQAALGMSVQDWLKTKPGQAFNQEQAIALGQTLEKTGQDFAAMRDSVAQARTAGTVSPNDEAALAQKAMEFAALEGVRSGAAAEAGRALRAFRQVLDGANASGQGVDKAVQQAFKAIGTDQDAFQRWTAAWKMIPPDDTAAQYKQLQLLYQPSQMSKVLAYTVNNMLSSTKTLGIIAAHGGVQTLNRPLIELLRGSTGARADALTDLSAMGSAIGQAFVNGSQAFLEGVGPTQAGMRLESGFNARPDAFPGKTGLVATPALRAIGALHEFWSTLSYAGAQAVLAAQEARATGKTLADVLATPNPGRVEEAYRMAHEAVTGGTPSPVGQTILRLRSLATKQDASTGERATGLAAHALFPFVSIPDYIYRNGLKQLVGPVAYPVIAGYHGLTGRTDLVRGDLAVAGATTALDAAIYGLAASGNLTGNGPTDPAKKNALMAATDAQGNPIWRPHSIRVAGRWYDYTTAAGPMAVPMAAIGSAVEQYGEAAQKPQNAGELAPIAAQTANATVKALLDSSYIRGFGDLMKSALEGQAFNAAGRTDAASNFAANLGSRFIPDEALLGEAARTVDQNQKEPTGIGQTLASRIPGLSSGVPNKVDVTTGKDVAVPQDVLSTAQPAKSEAPGMPNPVAAEVASHGLGVGNAPKTVRNVPLTPDEQRAYDRAQGQMLQERLGPVIGSKDYQNLSPADQARLVKRVVDEVRVAAGRTVLGQAADQNPAGLEQRQTTARQQKQLVGSRR